MSANQAGWVLLLNSLKPVTIPPLLLKEIFIEHQGLNTYFRLRHAYLTTGEFLVGQTWTNFGDVNASPNTLDLEGP